MTAAGTLGLGIRADRACANEEMKMERPILFSAPMVRAILEDRKSQTRRIIKAQPQITGERLRQTGGRVDEMSLSEQVNHAWRNGGIEAKPPYGRTGDRLWVKETFSGPNIRETLPPSQWQPQDPIWYWADGNPPSDAWTRPKPSIFMPRWASRIQLEIVDVRMERLHDISEEDARAEGVEDAMGKETPWKGQSAPISVHAYAALWERIHGAGGWAINPWVWVVEFRRLSAGSV
jgi:hypothetical protein